MKKKFLVVVERGESNYSAYSPDLPGCIATGKSIEIALAEMRTAMMFHLEGMSENGDKFPAPRSLNSYIGETGEISIDDIITSVEIEIPELALAG